jgi:hypothetical protein
MNRIIAAVNDGLTPKYNVQCRLWESSSAHTPFFAIAPAVAVDGWETTQYNGQ